MNEQILQTIFDDDDLGILVIKTSSKAKTEDERLIDAFEEINIFFENTGREPQKTKAINEMQLAARLEGLRNNVDNAKKLIDFDRHNLLSSYINPPETVDEILNDDMGILDVSEEEENLKTLRNVTQKKNKSDFVAKRKECEDFEKFEKSFKQMHADLSIGKKKLIDFKNVNQLQEGHYYISNGMMLYVDSIGRQEEVYGRMKERLRCIFENGTESNMFLRSLSSQLYEDGKEVVDESFQSESLTVGEKDEKRGIIYVVKTLRADEELGQYKNLCKIGFTRNSIEERTKNAEKDATFLMSPVEVLAVYECYNLEISKLENLLHRFFGDVKIDLTIADNDGDEKEPSEWFDVPLNIVDQAINLMIDGEIVNYEYDSANQKIKLKDE